MYAPHHFCSFQPDPLLDYHFELPSFFSKLFYEKTSESIQLFTEGQFDLVLEVCSDYWNGQGIGELNETVEKRLYEFYQNATLSDTYVIAYAYRPIPKEIYDAVQQYSIQPQSFLPFYIELPLQSTLPDDTRSSPDKLQPISDIRPADSSSSDNLKQHSSFHQKHRFCHSVLSDSKLDRFEAGTLIPEDIFYNEAIKSQTFLGLASMVFQPKHVIFLLIYIYILKYR